MEDVLIIGAGPAGAASAIILGRLGHRVLLADRDRFPRHKACGECVSPAAVPILRRLGIRDPEASGAHPYYGFKLVSPLQDAATLAYPKNDNSPYGYCWSRYRMDHELLQAAAATQNVRILEGCRIERLRRDENGWSADGVTPDGSALALRARAVIQANGSRPFLPGARRTPPRARRLCLIGHFQGLPDLEPLMECGIAGQRIQYLIGPKGRDSAVLCLVLDLSGGKPPPMTKEAMMRHWISRVEGLRGRFAPARFSAPVFGMPLNPYDPPSLAEDGLLRIGDATGYLDPITGEGVYRALRTAELAGRTLHPALLEGDLSRRHLRPYEAAVREEFLWVRRFAGLCAWALRKPRLAGRIIRTLSRESALSRQVAAIQGALEPARGFFSPGTLLRLAIPAA